MAKYSECAARPDELDSFTDLRQEEKLLKNKIDKLDDCRLVLSVATPTKHAVLTDLHNATTRLETKIGQTLTLLFVRNGPY